MSTVFGCKWSLEDQCLLIRCSVLEVSVMQAQCCFIQHSWCRRITIYSSVEENWKNCFKKQKIWKWEVCPEVRGSFGLCPQTGILGYTRKTLGSSMVNLSTYKKIMWPADKISDQTKMRDKSPEAVVHTSNTLSRQLSCCRAPALSPFDPSHSFGLVEHHWQWEKGKFRPLQCSCHLAASLTCRQISDIYE